MIDRINPRSKEIINSIISESVLIITWSNSFNLLESPIKSILTSKTYLCIYLKIIFSEL